jgi:hypothetical protein
VAVEVDQEVQLVVEVDLVVTDLLVMVQFLYKAVL